jgi:hypothetical protein
MGALRDSYNAHVEGLEGGVGSADPVAVVQEFGNPIHNIPAQPILGMAFVRRKSALSGRCCCR